MANFNAAPPSTPAGRAYADIPYATPEPQVSQRRGGRPLPRPLGPDDTPEPGTYDGNFLYHLGVTGRLCAASHGRKKTHGLGCMCKRCCIASKRSTLRHNAKGDTERVDPGPALERYYAWRAQGISNAIIAEQTGVSETTFDAMIKGHSTLGPTQHIQRATFDRIMSTKIDLESARPKVLVRADLTYRRMRSLARLGWTKRDVLDAVGKSCFKTYDPAGTHEYCSAGFARDIRDAYGKLGGHEASDLGTVGKRGSRTKARQMAIENGWEVPAAWDDPGTLAYPEGWIEEEPERAVIDEVAIDQAMAGVPTDLTPAERGVLYRRLVRSFAERPAGPGGGTADPRYAAAARGTGLDVRSIAGSVSMYRRRYGV